MLTLTLSINGVGQSPNKGNFFKGLHIDDLVYVEKYSYF